LISELDEDFEKLAPLFYLFSEDSQRFTETIRRIKEFYFENGRVANSSTSSLVDVS
jgi:hypothetical protein